MKVEMHTHTSETSPCAHINAKDVLKLYKEAGYDTVVITKDAVAAIEEVYA